MIDREKAQLLAQAQLDKKIREMLKDEHVNNALSQVEEAARKGEWKCYVTRKDRKRWTDDQLLAIESLNFNVTIDTDTDKPYDDTICIYWNYQITMTEA